jgi:hypothetical protein
VSPRRVRASLLVCAATAALLIAGCGGGGGGSVDVGPAADVPAHAPLYVDATVKPTGSAQTDAKAALSRILGTSDPGAKLISLIDKAGKAQPPAERFTYQQDIAPWIGKQVGAFFTSFTGDGTGAAVVETTNPQQALAFARKSESGATQTSQQGGTTVYTNPTDHDSFATVGSILLFGDDAAVKSAIEASSGDSLGDSSDYKDAIDNLPDDRLGTFYTVPKTLIAAIGAGQIGPNSQALLQKTAGDQLDKPVSGALTATANTLNLDFVGGSAVDTPESSLLGDVPSQAWLALGIGNLGDTVKSTVDQLKDQIPNFDAIAQQIQATTGASLDQLEGSLGDAVLYVQGTKEAKLSGALVVQTKDANLTGRLLSQLQGLLQLGAPGGRVRPLQLSGGGTGFQINDPSQAPQPVEIAQQGDEIVIAYGANSAEQTLAPASKLGDSPTFSTAKGQVSSLGTDFFLDFPSVFALAESQGAKSDPGYVQAKPYLDALSYLVSGSGSKGDQGELKAVLGLK